MKIFVPHEKDRNIYLDEIIFFSNHDFIFGNHKQYNALYTIVNIQFPEAIFDWKCPTQEQLMTFEHELTQWKKHSKIVYTLNDFGSHYDSKNKFHELFKLIYKYADGVVHLGKFSLENYKKHFSSDCLHTIIYHPLYTRLQDNFETIDFQNLVTVDLSDKYIVAVPGSIRSKEELKLILKIFKKIPVQNKLLVIPRILKFDKIPDCIPTRFRKYYRAFLKKRELRLYSKNNYCFMHQYLEYGYLVDLIQQSSLLIIPRIRNLNSGIFYLGLTFDKPMIIPEIGNLTEAANWLGFPFFNLKKENYGEVILETITLEKNQYFTSNEYLTKKSIFHPKKIAYDYDVFFNSLAPQ
jgi:hypothetical protein